MRLNSFSIVLAVRVFAWETGVQSQAESYQKLKKCSLMHRFLTLSIIRYEPRVNSSNPGEGVAPFPGVVAIEKRVFVSLLSKVTNFPIALPEK